MRRLSPGATGWVAVGMAVLAAELLDEKTMSEAFRAASRHPVAGPVMIAAWGVLTAHLFGVIPASHDPIRVFWTKVRNRECQSAGSAPSLT